MIFLESLAPYGACVRASYSAEGGPDRAGLNHGHRQIRQGVANNTKGTAFVVYDDVMDAKQACDKLNGFNFQNRYLVGQSKASLTYDLGAPPHSFFPFLLIAQLKCSPLSPAGEDGEIQGGSGRATGKSRTAEKAAWHRLNSKGLA